MCAIRAIIATVSKPQGICFIEKYPLWAYIRRDENSVRKLTDGHVIIIGVNVYEILPDDFFENRLCIIISNNPRLTKRHEDNCIIYEKIDDAIKFVTEAVPEKNVFFLGNGEIWKFALKLCSHMYITRVHSEYISQQIELAPLEYFPEFLSPKDSWIIDGHFLSIGELETRDGGRHVVTVDLIHYKRRKPESIQQD